MTTPSAGIIAITLVVVVAGIFFYFILAPVREAKKTQRDILARGQAAIGTIVAIDQLDEGRFGGSFGITVEFTPPGYPHSVQVRVNSAASGMRRLGLYNQVPIHFRETLPMEAVIDELVG